MTQTRILRLLPILAYGTLLALSACSSTSGGGSSAPAAPNVVVLPPGSKIVCPNGSDPPC